MTFGSRSALGPAAGGSCCETALEVREGAIEASARRSSRVPYSRWASRRRSSEPGRPRATSFTKAASLHLVPVNRPEHS
jgi:hypothetical protein